MINDWITYLQNEQAINHGKCLEAREEAGLPAPTGDEDCQDECRKFCKLVVNEYSRQGGFDRAHQKAKIED